MSYILTIDSTRISLLILVVLFVTSLHAAYRSWFLSKQALMLSRLENNVSDDDYHEGQSVLQDYIRFVLTTGRENESGVHAEVMAERLRGAHQIGWFMAGTILKLGLLGTVIGFVLMLSSLAGLENLDLSDIKQLMQQMTQGMGVAMNTTMVGLVASLILGGQYLILDRCADKLIADSISLGGKLSCSKKLPDGS